MAYYENLPIYKKPKELAVYMKNAVRGFLRYNKYTIGADMRNLSKNLISLIIKVNSRKDNRELLKEIRDKSEEMKINIMIRKEIKAFKSFRQFQHAASLAVEISRQSEGWLKSQEGKRPELQKT